MSRYLPALTQAVKDLCGASDDDLSRAAIIAAVNRATEILSRRSPATVRATQTGDGSTIAWTAPTGWDQERWELTYAYYPILDDGEAEDTELYPENFACRWNTSSSLWQFRLYDVIPANAKHVLFIYNRPHSITDTTTTIANTDDEDAVVNLATSFCFRILAAKYIRITSGAFSADAINYGDRSKQCLELAKNYQELSGLGTYLNSDTASGATGSLDWHSEPDFPAIGGWLTHGTA